MIWEWLTKVNRRVRSMKELAEECKRAVMAADGDGEDEQVRFRQPPAASEPSQSSAMLRSSCHEMRREVSESAESRDFDNM